MKIVRMLGLATATAALALALLGTGSAAADTLCKEAPDVAFCPAGKAYSLPTLISGKTPEVQFVAGALITEKCGALAKLEIEKNLGNEKGLEGQLTELLFTECQACENAVAQNMLYKATLTSSVFGNANLVFNEGTGAGIPSVEFINCGGVTCLYGAASVAIFLKASANGTSPAYIEVKAGSEPTLNKQAGSDAACPTTAKWTAAKYEITSPLPLWVARI